MIYGCHIGEMNSMNSITNKRGYDDKWGSYGVLHHQQNMPFQIEMG